MISCAVAIARGGFSHAFPTPDKSRRVINLRFFCAVGGEDHLSSRGYALPTPVERSRRPRDAVFSF